jgi:transposase
VIPEDANAEFVCAMEEVLAVYHLPYDPLSPVVCMDESPCQLIGEARKPFRDSQGAQRVDYEYVRNGVVSVFAAFEPLGGKRLIRVRDAHKTADFVSFMQEIAAMYPLASRITVVLDNLSTHKKSGFYKFLPPKEAKELADRFEFVFTPKHGSWLNMAEIELRVLKQQCLGKRMPDKATMEAQIEAWAKDKNNTAKKADWQFSLDDARIRLKRLYPKLGS